MLRRFAFSHRGLARPGRANNFLCGVDPARSAGSTPHKKSGECRRREQASGMEIRFTTFEKAGNMTLYKQVTEAVASIQARTTLKPAIALILGSGFGDIATELHYFTSITYT